MSVGFRICSRTSKIDAQLITRFKALPVANVSDNMSRMSAAGSRIRPMHGAGLLAGPAFTVKSRPGDNLMLHKAIDSAEPGDVIVCDAGGDLTNSLFGELMLAQCVARGLAGVVINGAIRDLAVIRASSFPVFAAGVTHRGPYKDGPGEINTAVALDGMVVEPGDLILGDDDGLLCVPQGQAQEILELAEAKHKAEEEQLLAIREGTMDRSWVDETLRQRGCDLG